MVFIMIFSSRSAITATGVSAAIYLVAWDEELGPVEWVKKQSGRGRGRGVDGGVKRQVNVEARCESDTSDEWLRWKVLPAPDCDPEWI